MIKNLIFVMNNLFTNLIFKFKHFPKPISGTMNLIFIIEIQPFLVKTGIIRSINDKPVRIPTAAHPIIF